MAELATIARPYAEALFKASTADLQGASAWLDALAAIAGDQQLLQVADNPKVSSAQVFDLVSSVQVFDLIPGVSSFALSEAAKNFLQTVIDNGRLVALPEIARQFRSLKNGQAGSSDAVVYSAFPLDDAALGDLSGTLERRFGRKLNLKVEHQPSLIGGVRVVVGDEVLDTSVQARLQQMKSALTA
jgi:F-type H+-transporting ATPase subunit delta